jgi:lipid-A-disaccharide synthase-like uncharacterized protein
MLESLRLAFVSFFSGGIQHCPTCGHARTAGLWLTIGFVGQAVFTARFLAQWIASEKRRDSVVPVVFWWLSLAGGFLLLNYAIHRQDPVIIVGQSMGVFIYVRNLMLVAKGRKRAERQERRLAEASRVDPAEGSGATAAGPHAGRIADARAAHEAA